MAEQVEKALEAGGLGEGGGMAAAGGAREVEFGRLTCEATRSQRRLYASSEGSRRRARVGITDA